MTRNDITNDLAFELFALWEDAKAQGNVISLEELCAQHPEALPGVREIARRLGSAAILFSANPQAGPGADVIQHPPDWIKIGSGASSIVYRGHDPTFGASVAYKVLHAQVDVERSMRRFEREAQILARLKHDGIVRIFKTFVLGEQPVLEMEYLPGGSLMTHLETVRSQGAAGIARFMKRVAEAVGFAHKHDIVHRDLKPSNILLDAAGRPCVSDFGVAKLLQPGDPDDSGESLGVDPAGDTDPGTACLTAVGHQPGTRAYMAPEQFDPTFGPISPATDVWALGVILYELINDARPFAAKSANAWKLVVCQGPPPPRRCSTWRREGRLEAIALRCLTRDPAKRYPSASALADTLAAVVRPKWRKPALVSGIVALATAAGAAMNSQTPIASPPQAIMSEAPSSQEEGSDETCQGLQAEFAQAAPDQPITIIGETGKPKWFRWKTGRASSGASANPGGCFQVESKSVALVELLPDPQTDRYRIAARVKHTRDLGGAPSVGLYVGRCAYPGGASDIHVLTHISFDDMSSPPKVEVVRPDGMHRTLVPMKQVTMNPLLLSEPDVPPSLDAKALGPVGPKLEDETQGDWHDIGVTVGPDELVAEWNRQKFSLPVRDWERNLAAALDRIRRTERHRDNPFVLNLRPQFVPRGGLGIYVVRASASFAGVTVAPVKQTQ
jgi:serine/threonine protein kinase